jgi:HAD superfamily hydrolase (TIGR01549 family)
MPARLDAILFDMDGTLTVPMLDFPRLKAEMGIGSRPILEALAQMETATRAAALAILHRHEAEAAEGCALNPGCTELLAWLEQHGIGVALITRNSRQSVQTVLARQGLKIDPCITREDAPHKPDPAPLRLAIQRLRDNGSQIEEKRVWMVGDGQYDIEAAIAAGVKGIWISHGRQRDFAAEPWHTVRDLIELRDFLTKNNHA